jgi:4-diphosphocytidyl-2-C-methyl-D-erythritol kinase
MPPVMTRCLRMPLTIKTPAKINWFLSILSQRDDGFHTIASLMQCVSLYDTIVFRPAPELDIVSDLTISVQDNLVYKAASLLKRYALYGKGAAIRLKKMIPVGAGLGGGSSDAACTLTGLNRLWGLGLSMRELSSLASQIGSDVPFFLNGTVAFVEGTGERVTPFTIRSSVVLLLVKPPQSVSTSWAYSAFDRRRIQENPSGFCLNPKPDKLTKKAVDIKLFCQALERKDLNALGSLVMNDLEEAVTERYPVVSEIKHRLKKTGAAVSSMSGSGSAVFGIFTNREKARNAARAMSPYWCKVVETLI